MYRKCVEMESFWWSVGRVPDRGLSIVSPSNLHGLSMVSPWNLHRISMVSPSRKHRLRSDEDPYIYTRCSESEGLSLRSESLKHQIKERIGDGGYPARSTAEGVGGFGCRAVGHFLGSSITSPCIAVVKHICVLCLPNSA